MARSALDQAKPIGAYGVHNHDQGPGPDGEVRAGALVCGVQTSEDGRDQWWPWPLVISLYSSEVGFGMKASLP